MIRCVKMARSAPLRRLTTSPTARSVGATWSRTTAAPIGIGRAHRRPRDDERRVTGQRQDASKHEDPQRHRDEREKQPVEESPEAGDRAGARSSVVVSGRDLGYGLLAVCSAANVKVAAEVMPLQGVAGGQRQADPEAQDLVGQLRPGCGRRPGRPGSGCRSPRR